MLRIGIPSNGPSGINFSNFESYRLPFPNNGMRIRRNKSIVLFFKDEDEAITYSDQLKVLSESMNDASSAQRKARNEVIEAIDNDERVREYVFTPWSSLDLSPAINVMTNLFRHLTGKKYRTM